MWGRGFGAAARLAATRPWAPIRLYRSYSRAPSSTARVPYPRSAVRIPPSRRNYAPPVTQSSRRNYESSVTQSSQGGSFIAPPPPQPPPPTRAELLRGAKANVLRNSRLACWARDAQGFDCPTLFQLQRKANVPAQQALAILMRIKHFNSHHALTPIEMPPVLDPRNPPIDDIRQRLVVMYGSPMLEQEDYVYRLLPAPCSLNPTGPNGAQSSPLGTCNRPQGAPYTILPSRALSQGRANLAAGSGQVLPAAPWYVKYRQQIIDDTASLVINHRIQAHGYRELLPSACQIGNASYFAKPCCRHALRKYFPPRSQNDVVEITKHWNMTHAGYPLPVGDASLELPYDSRGSNNVIYMLDPLSDLIPSEGEGTFQPSTLRMLAYPGQPISSSAIAPTRTTRPPVPPANAPGPRPRPAGSGTRNPYFRRADPNVPRSTPNIEHWLRDLG